MVCREKACIVAQISPEGIANVANGGIGRAPSPIVLPEPDQPIFGAESEPISGTAESWPEPVQPRD